MIEFPLEHYYLNLLTGLVRVAYRHVDDVYGEDVQYIESVDLHHGDIYLQPSEAMTR
jgi:hypothetical protein